MSKSLSGTSPVFPVDKEKIEKVGKEEKIVCAMRRRWVGWRAYAEEKSVNWNRAFARVSAREIYGGVGYIVVLTFGEYVLRENSLAKCWTARSFGGDIDQNLRDCSSLQGNLHWWSLATIFVSIKLMLQSVNLKTTVMTWARLAGKWVNVV